ncbi:Uncharacterized protein HDE_00405 [Halotydeus destructor]|nr:Uncharacterized protein HDE_00405 [Halotydeus destructor]
MGENSNLLVNSDAAGLLTSSTVNTNYNLVTSAQASTNFLPNVNNCLLPSNGPLDCQSNAANSVQQLSGVVSLTNVVSNNNCPTAINHNQLIGKPLSPGPPPSPQSIANQAAMNQFSKIPPTADHLAQLIKDRKQLAAFPNVFMHVERLLDEEISRVRSSLFQINGIEKKPLVLPEADGQVVQRAEKVYVPSKQYPDFNFVGRILGPRGMTAKQLEQETGCKIMVRGRGSMRDKKKEDSNRGKPNWEHLNDELHVLITVEDTPNRANVKIERAMEEVNKLLKPVTDGEDELKKRQLMELAIINGTYRDSSARQSCDNETARLMASPISGMSMGRTIGAPLILSPARHLMQQHPLMGGSPGGHPPGTMIQAGDSGLMYAHSGFDPYYVALAAQHQHQQQMLAEAGYPTTTSHQMTAGVDSLVPGPMKKLRPNSSYSPVPDHMNMNHKRPREL